MTDYTRIAALPSACGFGARMRLEELPPEPVSLAAAAKTLAAQMEAHRLARALQRARTASDHAATALLSGMPAACAELLGKRPTGILVDELEELFGGGGVAIKCSALDAGAIESARIVFDHAACESFTVKERIKGLNR